MRVLVIIPCFNEEKNIVDTVNRVKEKYDYIVINDGSTDKSLKVLQKHKFNYINLINNVGIGGAMQVGYKYASKEGYDIAIQFDGDGQHDENYIEKIISPIKNKEANMVIGSRFVGNESEFKSTRLRQIGIRVLSFLLKILTKKKINDMTSGFRAVDKKIIDIFSLSYPLEYPEPITNLSLSKKNMIIKEIPVRMRKRKYGKSSIGNINSIYYMFNVILLFLIINFSKEDGPNA